MLSAPNSQCEYLNKGIASRKPGGGCPKGLARHAGEGSDAGPTAAEVKVSKY